MSRLGRSRPSVLVSSTFISRSVLQNHVSQWYHCFTEPPWTLLADVLLLQMEYCEKSTLRNCIDAGLYEDMNRVWRLFREIIEGLVHIHEQVSHFSGATYWIYLYCLFWLNSSHPWTSQSLLYCLLHIVYTCTTYFDWTSSHPWKSHLPLTNVLYTVYFDETYSYPWKSQSLLAM